MYITSYPSSRQQNCSFSLRKLPQQVPSKPAVRQCKPIKLPSKSVRERDIEAFKLSSGK